MNFDEIFAVMVELAEAGNSFYRDAVAQYRTADADTKHGMRAWLEDEFADHDETIMDVKTALLLMMYQA